MQRITVKDFGMYGLRVRSEIDLPGWPLLTSAEPDVTVRREAVSAPLAEGDPHSARTLVEGGELTLIITGVGRYRATGGSQISVDPEPGARPEDLRLYLTGALMGTILHQRGVFPLHASCIAIDGNGLAFAGRSGAGKSTLVATMARRGAGFVSDDICVMTSLPGGRSGVFPGASRVKLDEKGLARHPAPAADLEPAGGNRGKYHLPMNPSSGWQSPTPLGRVYLISDGEGPPRLEPLSGLDAVSALVEETYFLMYAVALGLKSQVFRLAADVARSVQVIRLVRPHGLEHLPAVADLIERDARQA